MLQVLGVVAVIFCSSGAWAGELFSADDRRALQQFCDDPVTAICDGDGVTSRAARTQRIREIKSEISAQARHPEKEAEFTEAYQARTGAVMIPPELIETAKTILSTSIDVARLEPQVAGALKAQLKKIKVFVGMNGVDSLKERNAFELQYLNNCGPDGMEINSFYAVSRDLSPYVVVCPGQWLSLLSPTIGLRTARDALVVNLIHELGHGLDPEGGVRNPLPSTVSPTVYRPLRQCVLSRYAYALQSGRDSRKAKMLSEFNPITLNTTFKPDPTAKREDLVDDHIHEIIGDHWAALGAASLLEQHPLETLRAAYGWRCGAVDQGQHPSGQFRIEMLRRTDAVAKKMGCPVRFKGKAGCSL